MKNGDLLKPIGIRGDIIMIPRTRFYWTSVSRPRTGHLQGLMVKCCYLVLFALTGYWSILGALAVEASDRFIDLPSAKLWTSDSGGIGEAVLLLPNSTTGSEGWQYTIPALKQAGLRVIAIEYPGWGKSIARDPQNPRPLAEVVDELIDHLKLDQVHLVGAALGGYIAVDYAAWRPGRVRSMVIAASGLGLVNDPEVDAFNARAAIPGLREQHWHTEFQSISPNYRATNPEGMARLRLIYNKNEKVHKGRPPQISPNTPEKLASIKAPTFLIAGGMDLVTPAGSVRLYRRHLTVENEFLLIPEAGHVPFWEEPEIFNRALIEFLLKH